MLAARGSAILVRQYACGVVTTDGCRGRAEEARALTWANRVALKRGGVEENL